MRTRVVAQKSMDLRHIRYFVVAAEEENLRRAAARLHIAQPALSRHIRGLEEQLGFRLFERLRRRVRLSDAGKAFLEDARKILEATEQATSRARQVHLGQAGVLRVGVHYASFRNPLVPKSLQLFRSMYPEAELRLVQLLSQDQVVALRTEQIDLGFVLYHRQEDFQDFNRIELGRDHFMLALPAFHRLARSPSVRLKDLNGEPFLWLQRSINSTMYDKLMNACLDAGLSPKIVQHVLTEETSPHLVSSGMGIAFVLASSQGQQHHVAYKEVTDLNIPLHLDMLWRKANGSAIVERFTSVVLKAKGGNPAMPAKTMEST